MLPRMGDHDYSDIIGLPHPVSTRRARMSRKDRAAQFAPFSALTGLDGTLEEAGRLTDSRQELTDSRVAELDGTLQQLLQQIHRFPQAQLTWFRPDDRKAGGAYVTQTVRVRRVDACNHTLVLTDRTAIPIGDIYDIRLV